MKIQSKIYTSKATAIRLGFGEIDRAVCYPNDIEGIEMVEYTNLSDVWNDINNSTPITNGVAYEYPIIVYAKLQRVLKVGIVITPEELANIAKLATTKFDKVLWAYAKDLVSGVIGKGE
jgi:hypothetical protein